MEIDPSNYDYEDPDDALPDYQPPPATSKPAPLRLVQPSETIPNPPPHAPGVEKSALSVAFQYPEKIVELTPDHFYLPAHREILDQIQALSLEGLVFDLTTFAQRLHDKGLLDRVGGPSALADIYTHEPSPLSFDQHLAILSEKAAARAAISQARSLIEEIEASPGESLGIIEQATKNLVEARGKATHRSGALAKAYALSYDHTKPQPADEVVMMLGDSPVAATGGLTGIQGKMKAGKSAVVASILGAALRGKYVAKGDTLGFEWKIQKDEGSVIHFDTEQSPGDWWGSATRAVMRSGVQASVSRFVSIPLVQFSLKERREIIEATILDQYKKTGINIVVIDGLADICLDPNDPKESFETIRWLMELSHKCCCAIVCVLHENHDSDSGKTRGHLGSELGRKAFANLRVDKDAEGISTLYGTHMRKKDIPKSQGVCFSWSESERMHITLGTSREIEAERNSEKSQRANSRKTEEVKSGLEDIFGEEESLLYSELWPAVMDRFSVKERMAKNKISEWIRASIITKNDKNGYVFTP